MSYKVLFIVFISIFSWFLFNSNSPKQTKLKTFTDAMNNVSAETLLIELGAITKPSHYLEKVDLEQAELGRQLIFLGYATRNGKKSKLISPYFKCTDCHNINAETSELADITPESRLAFARNNNLAFLPGSPFYGIYNRNSFYNDDYVKKYGSLVDAARHDLRRSIQVCAKYCSSGRYIEDWEQEAILHYYKSKELKVSDLKLDDETKSKLANIKSLFENDKKVLGDKISALIPQKYAATFLPTMDRNLRKYGKDGDIENGKAIYEKSCMYCHLNSRVTYLNIEANQITGKYFWRNITKYTDQSLYKIIRYGTYAKVGRKQYMPMYTKEKMSDEQLNDLVAYVKQLAKVR
jgi:mono/diheme cytochrome c family protein